MSDLAPLHVTRLHLLHDQQGQSPWLDDLTRGYLTRGELSRWVDAGVRAVTSNPTIFQRIAAPPTTTSSSAHPRGPGTASPAPTGRW